jgi:protein-tyrosine phosphatase
VAVRHILFVCTGNTGRSVAAEALARQWIARQWIARQWIARQWIAHQWIATPGLAITAGSRGVEVDPANTRPEPHVVTLLAARGLDVAAHRATALTATDVAAAAHILTMTARHREIVHTRFPAARRRTRMLSEAASGAAEDVPDAFGAPFAVYEAMLARLDALLQDALARLAG